MSEPNSNGHVKQPYQVKLGSQEYTIVPQPHAVLFRKFPQVLAEVRDGGLTQENITSGPDIINVLGDRIHGVLKIFIPDLMPFHEFQGFPSQEALDEDRFDEAYAVQHAPTIPEIMEAFDQAINVNGGKRLKDLLGNVLGPDLSRAVRSFVVARMRVSLSEMSANLPSQNDGSETLTTSGAKSPTPEDQVGQENEDSLSLASSTS